jgi:hypothetical protein
MQHPAPSDIEIIRHITPRIAGNEASPMPQKSDHSLSRRDAALSQEEQRLCEMATD